MQSSTVAAANNEAELKRQRERQKAKDRKKRRSGGGGGAKKGGNAAAAAASEREPEEDFVAFSTVDAEEMNDVSLHQQQMVDDAAEEEAAAAPVEEPQEEQAEEEEHADDADADVEMADADEAAVEPAEDDAIEAEEAQEEEDEEAEASEVSAAEEDADADEPDDAVPVDVVDPDEDAMAVDEPVDDEDATSALAPSPTPDSTFLTPAPGSRSKKRTSTHTPAAAAHSIPPAQRVRLSTFGWKKDQVSYDPSNQRYTLSFRSGERLAFHGSVAFEVEEGYIEVHGHTFKPTSKRVRWQAAKDGTSGSAQPLTTHVFHAHSWSFHPHALLTFTAPEVASSAAPGNVLAGAGGREEFVARVRFSVCESRFAPQRLQAMLAGVSPAQIQPPTELHRDPYALESHGAAAAEKTPAKSAKKKGKTATAAAETVSSESYFQLHIPGFTPVLYSDDDLRAAAAAEAADSAGGSAAASSTDAIVAPVPTKQRSTYGLLTIPPEWNASLHQMLQVPSSSSSAGAAMEDAEEEKQPAQRLSKSEYAAQKHHRSDLATHIRSHGLRTLVYGARNSGKSTLLSYMMNLALNKFRKVCYLDLDLGQSTLNPSGLIALHEVTSPMLSTSAHIWSGRARHTGGAGSGENEGSTQEGGKMLWSAWIGDVTHSTDPSLVLSSILAAVSVYSRYRQSQSEQVPLLINTPGWLTGLGLEVIREAARESIQPAYMVELKVEKEEDAVEGARKKRRLSTAKEEDEESELLLTNLTHPHELYQFQRHLDSTFSASLISSSTIASAPRLRQLQLLAYFTSGVRVKEVPFALAGYATLLSTMQPYRLPFVSAAISVLGASPSTSSSSGDFDPSSILLILQGSLVGLCVQPMQGRVKPRELLAKKTGLRIALPSAGTSSTGAVPRCLGLGIIRSIDLAARCFHLVTPIALNDLQQVNLLQKGRMELPQLAFGIDSYGQHLLATSTAGGSVAPALQNGTLPPYLSTTTLAAGGGHGTKEMASRHNIQRRRLE